MILDSELDVPSAPLEHVSRQAYFSPVSRYRVPLLVLLFFGVTLLLQVASGAYHAEFAGYPDAPAHYVTSVMVRQYILRPTIASPFQFAADYYHQYPKVALGHWPPVLYVVQALWMTMFSVSRASVLLELAFTTMLLAHVVYAEARRWLGSNAAILAGLLTVCLPLVQTYTHEEMAETLLTLTCFLSAVCFARYLDSGHWKDSLGFAIFCSLAILTKGSGWLLGLVPPIALLLTRKLWLLRERSFWLPVPIVAVLCLPWQLATMSIAERGWAGGNFDLSYTLRALAQFGRILFEIASPVLGILAIIGLVGTVLGPMLRKPVASLPAVMAAFIAAVWVFHALVPAGIEDRKMIIAVPALILFIFAGGFWIAGHLPLGERLAGSRALAVAGVAGLCFFLQGFAIPHAPHYGYAEAARFISARSDLQRSLILVSSGSVGEGLLISEMAMCEPRPRDRIIRASKVLAQVEWNGSHYRAPFSTPSAIINELDRRHVDLLVTDIFSSESRWQHVGLVKQAIQENPSRFHLLATFSSGDSAVPGEVRVYRLTPAA